MMAQLAPRRGAASVTVVDRNPARLEVAKEVGVEITRRVGRRSSDRRGGWEVVIDCTGVVPAIEDGLRRIRRGGTFQQFGVAPSRRPGNVLAVPDLQRRDQPRRIDGRAELVRPRRRDVCRRRPARRRMVSHAFCLDDYADALDQFRAGRGRKLQIRPQAARSVELL